MANFDLMKSISSIAPTIATMLGGPLAGAAVASLESAFGVKPSGTSNTASITKVIQDGSLTTEQMAAIRLADQQHESDLKQKDFDLIKLNKDFELAQTSVVVNDRKNARLNNSSRDAVWWLAGVVLITFAVLMSVVLYGCWVILAGGIIIKDVSVVAGISGLVGSVVGYIAANAQTVINFIYGGSLGSEKKTDAMAVAVQQAINSVSSK